MAMYSVIAPDGQAYGPADEQTLAQWAREGRLNAQSVLQDATTSQRVYASQVPAIAVGLGAAAAPMPAQPSYQQPAGYQQPVGYQQAAAYQQPAGYQQQQTAIPAAYGMGYQQPAAQGYAQPQQQQQIGYANPYAPVGQVSHALTSFSPVAALFLHWVTFGLFSLIYHQMKHGSLPMTRQDDPTAGKAIGFMFIPIFGPFYWNFFANLRLCDRLNYQRQAAGLPPTAPRSLAMAFAICMVIPYVNIFVGIPILGAIYSCVLQANVNELVRATRGPNA